MSDAQPTGDHYATLGVTPRCEDVVIRAAYLALMHRYHPDKSSLPASAERAQAINAAYAVLGDPETRIRYDWERRRAAELAVPPPPRLSGMHQALIAVSVMLLLTVPLLFMRFPQTVGPSLARPTAEGRAPTAVRPSPPASALMSKSGPIERPRAEVAAIAAPRADQPIKPATIEKQATAPRPQADRLPSVPAPAPRASLASIERPLARKEVKVGTPPVGANAKCLSARPGADTAVCKDDNLAALDRLGETYYGQSMRVGDATKRAALVAARNGFLGRREACRSDSCLRSAYSSHMRDISAIVESKQPTTR